jgi:hypothetical protein
MDVCRASGKVKTNNKMILGYLNVDEFLKASDGKVAGSVVTDAKDRHYFQDYLVVDNGATLTVKRRDDYGDAVTISKRIELDHALVAFFGLYSGDGAKGSESQTEPGRIVPTISFSQKEKHLVRFAVDQFRRLFPGAIRFTFSLGEDSAYFMAGDGQALLDAYYQNTTGAGTPLPVPLVSVCPQPTAMDTQYLTEVRPDVRGSNEEHLSFYYQHKDAMEKILSEAKAKELASVGIEVGPTTSAVASLRRPFKKGARTPGGSSRSDEIHVGGLRGLGELFLKMMHEIEDSVMRDSRQSTSELVEWNDIPSKIGSELDLVEFFQTSPYGRISGRRPVLLERRGDLLAGRWHQSSEMLLKPTLRLSPLWCYVAGLYLAEGTTPKEALFKMFSESPGAMALGFTSSEGASIELVLRALGAIFQEEDCVHAWKVKVGSQYFPELVMTGLKHGMAMLRGGSSGDGKLRTMEISLGVQEWALAVADMPFDGQPSLLRKQYAHKYSHVEPTGSGVARIDLWASSTLCRWYFPLLMFTVFGNIVPDPTVPMYS